MGELKTENQDGHRTQTGLENDSSPSERELLQEILRALRAIRYGSVNLTVHDGRIVEIQKTERIRKTPVKKD